MPNDTRMSKINDLIGSAADSALNALTTVQERILEAQQEVLDRVAEAAPEPPEWVPTPETPDVKELIEQTYRFQAKLLDANRSFSLALVDNMARARSKTSATPRPRTAARAATTAATARKAPAKKTAARKTTAKKSAAKRTAKKTAAKK